MDTQQDGNNQKQRSRNPPYAQWELCSSVWLIYDGRSLRRKLCALIRRSSRFAGCQCPVIGLKTWNIASLRDGNANWLRVALPGKIPVQSLSQFPCFNANDVVFRRVVVRTPAENSTSNLLFVKVLSLVCKGGPAYVLQKLPKLRGSGKFFAF